MNFAETAIIFPCAGERLLGVLCAPVRPAETGVVVIVGGPQYRVGSHRQFLLFARRLAGEGCAVFRFDYRGMGDSTGEVRNFERVEDDIAAAIGAFQAACPNVGKIVLWGLCDGASAALLYWHARRDERVSGMCLLNPWVRSEASLARTQVKHYYGQRLLQREFWLKLFRGEVRVFASIGGLLHKLRLSAAAGKTNRELLPFQTRMARALRAFPGKATLVLSGRDYTAKEFLEYARADPEWAAALGNSNVRQHEIPDADHTFSTKQWRGEVEQATLNLVRELSERACHVS